MNLTTDVPRTWGMTLNVTEALARGYIGEVVISPKPLADALNLHFTGKRLKPRLVFYFGEPDDTLRELFGYPPVRNGSC